MSKHERSRLKTALLILSAVLPLPALVKRAEARAPRMQSQPTGLFAQFGGFEVAGDWHVCESLIDAGVKSAGLTVTLTGTPDRIAQNDNVSVGVACLQTASPKIMRVVVVAAATVASTAEFYRNDVRARIEQLAHHIQATGAGGPPARAQTLAPISMCNAGGIGKAADFAAARQAAGALGMSADAPTSGGEIALSGGGAIVVIATSDVAPLNSHHGPVSRSVITGFGTSIDGETGKARCSAVRELMTTDLAAHRGR